MKNKFIKKEILSFLLTFFLGGMVTVHSSASQDTTPLDRSIRHGKLSNGLTYYIKPTNDGSSKMDIRLLIKAGTAVQDADQYELGHVLEHVAFKAGKHMTMAKAHDLGFNLGQINANVSIDFTQYYFKSVDTEAKRDIAFQLMQDIIWGLELKSNYIDSERSTIINENAIRGRLQWNAIMNSLEGILTGRLTMLPKDVNRHIKTFPYEALKRYYKDWYRPDLTAIVVLGDIDDINVIEKEIREKFSKIKKTKNPRSPYKDYSHYRNLPPQFIKKENLFLLKDPMNETVHMSLYMRQNRHVKEHGLKDLQNEQIRDLFIRMLRKRIKEKQEQAYATGFSVIPEFLWRPSLGMGLKIAIEHGSEKEVVLKIIKLFRQLHEYGFSQQEFKKTKEEYLKYINELDTTNVYYWVHDIRKHFLYDRVIPSNKKTFLMDMVNNLTVTEFNQLIKKYIKTEPKSIDITILIPSGHPALNISEKKIRNWISEANDLSIHPYSPPVIPNELMDSSTIAGLKESSVQEKHVAIPGVTEYQLANGVKVVLKPIDSSHISEKRHCKLSFHGFTSKGISSYPKTDYFSVKNASEIVYNSGVGGLNKFELKGYFTNKGFNGNVYPYIEYNESGIKGYISLSDLEMALQLVYLYFTLPNKDSLAFTDWKLNTTSSFDTKNINEDIFRSVIRDTIGDYTIFPRNSNPLKDIAETDIHRAFDIYQDIYGNAKNFTFIFSGNFPRDKVLSLCRKYLGNLPIDLGEGEWAKPLKSTLRKFQKPNLLTIPSVEYSREAKMKLVYISKVSAKDLDWKEEIKLKLLQSLLSFSLMQEIRFNSNKKGQTYSIGSYGNLAKSRLFNEIFIEFSSDPEDVEQLSEQTRQFVEDFKNNMIDVELLERFIKERKQYLKSEGHREKLVNEKIHDYYRFGVPWRSIEQEQNYLESLTPEHIKNTTQRLLKEKPLEFMMIPSKNLE